MKREALSWRKLSLARLRIIFIDRRRPASPEHTGRVPGSSRPPQTAVFRAPGSWPTGSPRRHRVSVCCATAHHTSEWAERAPLRDVRAHRADFRPRAGGRRVRAAINDLVQLFQIHVHSRALHRLRISRNRRCKGKPSICFTGRVLFERRRAMSPTRRRADYLPVGCAIARPAKTRGVDERLQPMDRMRVQPPPVLRNKLGHAPQNVRRQMFHANPRQNQKARVIGQLRGQKGHF